MNHICPKCQTENLNTSKFCKKCGYYLLEHEEKTLPVLTSTEIKIEPEAVEERHKEKNDTINENNTESKSWNMALIFIFPIIFAIYDVYREHVSLEDGINLIVGSTIFISLIILVPALIIGYIVYVIQVNAGKQYSNFIKHTFIATVVLSLSWLSSMTFLDFGDDDTKKTAKTHLMLANSEMNRGDYPSAANNYRKACEWGDTNSCVIRGNMNYQGQGVKQDPYQAKKWYKKACDGGSADGCSKFLELNNKGY